MAANGVDLHLPGLFKDGLRAAGSGQVEEPVANAEPAEDRPTAEAVELDDLDPALLRTAVPEIDLAALEDGVRPGEPDPVVMLVLGRKIIGQQLARGRPHRVNIATAVVGRIRLAGRLDDGVVVPDDFFFADAEEQVLSIVDALDTLAETASGFSLGGG